MIRFKEEDIKYLAIELPYNVAYCKYCGNFGGEIIEIDRLLKKELPQAIRMRLIIERVIAEGMLRDYKTDFDTLLAKVQKKFPACDAAALREIIGMGQVDFIYRDSLSRMYFQNAAAANIFKCHSDYLRRLTDPDALPDCTVTEKRLENARVMREKGSRAYRFTLDFTLTPDEQIGRDGEIITVHLPYPVPCASQPWGDIKLLSSTHEGVYISNSAQRTACIRAPHSTGADYGITFSYVNRALYRDLDPNAVSADQPCFMTGELYPHIRFTPLICELAAEIAGEEKNPLRLARRVYDWVTENIKYSYMRDYLLIDNIPEYAILSGRGDCGVMALTFITLCRRLGIPARWESGCAVTPDGVGSHDWASFYVAPYGWLYADPSYGGGARVSGCDELWNHYFGNLDPFRLVANAEFQQPLSPPKQFMRSDPYDNQSGEAEFEDYGLSHRELTVRRRVISAEEL